MRSRHSQPRGGGTPRGLTAVDVLVTLFLAALLVLVLLMSLPRGREQARLSACQKNLAQIGLALAQYEQSQGVLPTLGPPAAPRSDLAGASPGPLRILLETLGLADFRGLAPNVPLPGAAGPVPGETPVPGFVCASDPNATAGLFRAPVSYRAVTGASSGDNSGAFAPERRLRLKQVEDADGASFTAAFSERLVGDGSDHAAPANYAVAPGPLPLHDCALSWLEARQVSWRGDAGAAWTTADYRSTLYTHGPRPNAPCSCVAADGATALMGASSGHVRGVNLLMLDGAVKLVLPSVAPAVWREFAAIRLDERTGSGR